MNFLGNVSFTLLVDILDYTSNELKEQVANGDNKDEWGAVRMAKNQAFLAVLKEEVAKRLFVF